MQRSRIKVRLIGGLAVVVAVIATALALGGSGSSNPPSPATVTGKPASGGLPVAAPTAPAHQTAVGSVGAPAVTAPVGAPPDALTSGGTGGGAGIAAGTALAPESQRSIVNTAAGINGSGVTATRIVKTGSLDLRVAKGAVQSTISKLTALANSNGGYVARSTTEANSTDPSGYVELRVPVAAFTNTLTAAETFGHVRMLTTSAHDVTGKYVDLNARMQALQRTRSTYLAILSRATTIGATLSVQQRIDDIQQQIDELHGEIKLLAGQSSYSTLDVSVDQPSIIVVAKAHHPRRGLSKAWHTSISRFNRGIDAIVSGLGPLLLAMLLIGFAIGVTWLGLRGARRHGSSDATG